MVVKARRAVAISAAGMAVAFLALGTGLTLAQAAPQPDGKVGSDEGAMPSAVETFEHPGAAKAFAERAIKLKKGDGHIFLTDCSVSRDIQVDSRLIAEPYCFSVSAKSGYLSLELPDAYAIWTEDQAVRAKVTAEGKETIVNIPKNDMMPVGEGDSPSGEKRSVLIELRVSG